MCFKTQICALSVTTWNVYVYTSDVSNSGTDANVGICLYGKKGKSDEIMLDNKSDNFEKGALDSFKVNISDIGQPYKLRVYHDNTGRGPGWHLNKVKVFSVLHLMVKTSIKFY